MIREDEGDMLYTELVLLPGAAGPPMHCHPDFEEAFVVQEGTLEVETAEGVRTVHQGESYSFPPGMRHRPFNSSNDRVVLRGRIPARFAACLSQLYPALDNGSAVVLQLSLMRRYCDTHVAPRRRGGDRLRPRWADRAPRRLPEQVRVAMSLDAATGLPRS